MRTKWKLKKFRIFHHIDKKIKILAKFVDTMDAQTNISKIH